MLMITHEWTCDVCGQKNVASKDHHILGTPLRNPWPPDNWSVITVNGTMKVFCERHIPSVTWTAAHGTTVVFPEVTPWETPQDPVSKS